MNCERTTLHVLREKSCYRVKRTESEYARCRTHAGGVQEHAEQRCMAKDAIETYSRTWFAVGVQRVTVKIRHGSRFVLQEARRSWERTCLGGASTTPETARGRKKCSTRGSTAAPIHSTAFYRFLILAFRDLSCCRSRST